MSANRLSFLSVNIAGRWFALTQAVLWTLLVPGCGKEHSSVPDQQSPELETRESAELGQIWPDDDRRNDRYVGSAACAACHQDITRDYFSSHPMGQSVKLPTQLTDDVTAAATFQAGTRHYAAQMDRDTLTQTESMRDTDGIIYEQSCRIDFAIGSGTRGYTFATVRNGCLYQAPLTWYAQKKMWDLSPGYDPADHPRFERRMSDGCIVCHAGRTNRLPTAVNRFRNPIFLEAAIGCEQCHGPGEGHVAFQSDSGRSPESDTIVNPADLDPIRRDSVCFQCHLHGRDRILRSMRSDYDFRPGDRLSDIWVTFVDKSATDAAGMDSKAVSQVEQMVASLCYRKSDGRLGCISCHDPHRLPPPDARIQFYRQRCLACHEDPADGCSVPLAERQHASPQDSCIQCHMPASAASDVPHTAQTDHRVRRTYTDTTVRGIAEPGVFESDTMPVPNEEIQRAYGLVLAKTARTQSDAAEAMDLLAPFIKGGVNDQAMLSAAAWLLIQLGDLPTAEQLARQTINLNINHESALKALVVILQTKKDYDAALEYL
ncbi:MAG: hypothetical protein ABGZ24_24110, partial [Fuerstiella sp.]